MHPMPARRFGRRSLCHGTQKVPHQPAVSHRPGQRQRESGSRRSGIVRETDGPAKGLRQVERAHRSLVASPVEVDRLVARSLVSERPDLRAPGLIAATVGAMADYADVALAKEFGEIARILIAEADPHATLQRVVSLAVETIDGCEHAGISVIEGRKVTSPASSDEVPAIVDRIQSDTGEGPCVDAITEHEVFQTGRLSEEERWPNFTPRAIAESRVESILSLRLFVAEGTMGALNLYSTQPDAFDERDVAVATVFAAHAAVAWSTSQTIENLRAGMVTRQLIGQAVGLLMVRQGMSESDALEALRRASQRLNVKLRQVAESIVHPRGAQLTDGEG